MAGQVKFVDPEVLKVWSDDAQSLFRVCKASYFQNDTKKLFACSRLFSHQCAGEFPRGSVMSDEVTTPIANRMCACIFLSFLNFLRKQV